MIAIVLALLLLIVSAAYAYLYRRYSREKALTRNLETITDTVPIGMCMVDKDLNVIWGNRQIKEFYGYEHTSIQDVKGTNFADLLDPSLVLFIKENLQNNANLNIITFEGAMKADRTALKDFEEGAMWMKVSYVPIKDRDGQLKHYILLNENHTTEKLATYQLEQTNATIQRQLAEIKLLNHELHLANQNLDHFTAIASHDLKAPLRTIQSFSQVLAGKIEHKLNKEEMQLLSFITEGASKMNKLIEDLLSFSKVGEQPSPAAGVDMNEIVEQVALNLDTLIQETEARLVFERLPPVLGHKNLLVQLLQNLLSNALKFSRPDRRLVISVASSRLSADSVQFTIQDNGIGIPPAQADTVFEAFTRLHAEDAFQGSGLGLAICKKIVRYYGGSIWIESEEGRGTRVFFTLPAAT